MYNIGLHTLGFLYSLVIVKIIILVFGATKPLERVLTNTLRKKCGPRFALSLSPVHNKVH